MVLARTPSSSPRTLAATADGANPSTRPPVACHASVFPDVDMFDAWSAANTRAELLSLLTASAWWIHRDGNEQAVTATINAIFDTSRWWR